MEILYVKVVNRKIEIHTTTEVLKGPVMLQLERLLSGNGFEKIDQNMIVNMHEVTNYDPNTYIVYFEQGESCPVSRTNRKKVASHFNKK